MSTPINRPIRGERFTLHPGMECRPPRPDLPPGGHPGDPKAKIRVPRAATPPGETPKPESPRESGLCGRDFGTTLVQTPRPETRPCG